MQHGMEQRSGILEGYSCCLLSRDPGFLDPKVKGAQVLSPFCHTAPSLSSQVYDLQVLGRACLVLLLYGLPFGAILSTKGCICHTSEIETCGLVLQSAFHHACEYWNHTKDRKGAYKLLVAMLEADPERPAEVPFSEAAARLWGTYNVKPGPLTKRCTIC